MNLDSLLPSSREGVDAKNIWRIRFWIIGTCEGTVFGNITGKFLTARERNWKKETTNLISAENLSYLFEDFSLSYWHEIFIQFFVKVNETLRHDY